METSFFFMSNQIANPQRIESLLSDQDGIYTGSVELDTPYLGVEFKCVLNGYQFELEEPPNRVVEFDEDGETAIEVVFDQR